MSTVGNRIRLAREAKGITQEQLGKLCNTTKQTIFKYENGIVTNIPIDRIQIMARYLNVTPSYLMGWSEPTASSSAESGLKLTTEEKTLIQKYRKLDARGRSAVMNVLDHELATAARGEAYSPAKEA